MKRIVATVLIPVVLFGWMLCVVFILMVWGGLWVMERLKESLDMLERNRHEQESKGARR